MAAVLLGVMAVLSAAGRADAADPKPPPVPSTADHSKFVGLNRSFASGPEVTKACLDCHTEAGGQVMKSIHWTWEFKNPETGQVQGKRFVANNFCGSPLSNEPRCTSCHAGYNWKDGTFDFTRQENVDCLVCHDTTGTYKKLPAGAGHPAYVPTEVPPGSGKVWQPPDLTKVAQKIGEPGRANCGACHFSGGGGDGVKHGDMDSSLANPPRKVDVHMSKDGADLVCNDCHSFSAHQTHGSRFAAAATDTKGIDRPAGDRNHATCQSCHDNEPHRKANKPKLDDHLDKVACQTCHIPTFARGGVATKMWWDWSVAGRMNEKGKPYITTDDHGHQIYISDKGEMKYAENVVPDYKWFDGNVTSTLITDKIDDTGIVALNRFGGGYDDPKARIWPFKTMRGKQPYDSVNKTLVVNHVYGKDENALWGNYNWNKAIKAGMDYAGLPFSGQYGFVETAMYWPLTHMVAPKEDALKCGACHAREGRLAGLTGFYLPGRDRDVRVDLAGFALIGAIAAGVAGHGALRVLFFVRRRRR